MRVAHITDLHVERFPNFVQLASKRALGAVNLYLLGRKGHFDEASARAAVAAVVEAEPELVVCTGDLTSTASPQEFEAAAALLAPITTRFPFLVLPGNHDVYTRGSVGRFRAHFGEWSNGAEFPFVRRFGGVDFVAVDTVVPSLLSKGECSAAQLERLDAVLGEGEGPAILLLHYPLRNRRGEPYGPWTRNLDQAGAIEAVMAKHPRVVAALHGHEHHGYRTTLPGGAMSYDPGASGYAYLPDKRRTAHWNLYEVGPAGIDTVHRYAYDGARFTDEPGGAYATGG